MSENRYTILCVDDEPAILNALRRTFRKTPYNILLAESGAQGLALLKEHPAELVISDHRMPNTSGIDFLIAVRELLPDTMRIILSGFVESASVIKTLNSGAVHKFITKPWDEAELLVTIRQCLEQYELRRENKRMTEQIAKQNQELRRFTDELETMVAERSRALLFAQEILVNLPLPIIGVSSDRSIVFGNKAAEKLFGERYLTFLGNDAGDVFSEETGELIARSMREGVSENGRLQDNGSALRMRCLALGENPNDRRAVLIFEPCKEKEP